MMKDVPNQAAAPLGDTAVAPLPSSLQPSSGPAGTPPAHTDATARAVLDVTLARLATSSPEVVQNAIRVMMTGIAKLKQRELELAATAERLALATRAGGVGIWDYDVVNNRLTWDAQMFRLYGITNSSFGGAHESWQAGLHPEDRQRIDEAVQLALRGEKEFDVEYRVLWPDGTIRHIHACAVVQRDVSGQPLRVIGTNWDITPHHRLEALQKELEVKFQQLQ